VLFASGFGFTFVRPESRCRKPSQCRFSFNLRSQPHTELEYPKKFFGAVEKTRAITGRMSGKIIIHGMRAAEGVGGQMVGLPLALYRITADVTSAACLGKHLIAFAYGKRLSDHIIAEFELALAPRLTKRTQKLNEGCTHFTEHLFRVVGQVARSSITEPSTFRRVCDQNRLPGGVWVGSCVSEVQAAFCTTLAAMCGTLAPL
jgi:hypothetical protein